MQTVEATDPASVSLWSDVARTSDPWTSHAAGVKVTQDGTRARQSREAVESVHKTPGHTSAELASIHGLDRYAVARRLPEVERAGFVLRGTAKTCTVTGRAALTWWTHDTKGVKP
jgi:hypothetical protein